jgi:selenocysteine lyase/cysteine desulfurase
MQKNIVSVVNQAWATADKPVKKKAVSAPDTTAAISLEEDINLLKKENSQLICDVEEARQQNKELQEKIERLLTQASSAKKNNKKPSKKRTGMNK